MKFAKTKKALAFVLSFCMFMTAFGVTPIEIGHNHSHAAHAEGCLHEVVNIATNDEYHYYMCVNCGEATTEPQAHVATDDINCGGTLCGVCLTRYGEGTGEHVWSEDYTSNEDMHSLYCLNCGISGIQEAHVPGEYYCNFIACAICNAAYGTGLGGHTLAEGSYVYNNEYHYTYCSVCDATLSEEAHVPTDDINCDGTLCAVCNNRYGEGIGEHDCNIYYNNDETHYYACSVCGLSLGEEAHTPGEVNCGGTYCALCNNRYGEGTGEHVLYDHYNYDESAHWIYCSVCSTQTGYEAHSPIGDMECGGTLCEICNGYFGEGTGEHEWSDYGYNNETHYRICNVCSIQSAEEAHTPGEVNCSGTYCAVCNGRYGEGIGEHTWGNEYWFDSTSHWLECTSCGARSEGEEHTQADYSDCTNTYCSVCFGHYGDGTGEHTPADSYTYDDEYHYTYCSVCGTILSEEAHVATDDVNCGGTLCGVCLTRYGEGTGEHTWGNYSNGDETHTVYCMECGFSLGLEAHVPTDDINCGGTLCAVCNNRYGEGIGEHIPADSYSYNDRIHCIYCSICNDILSEEAHVATDDVNCQGILCAVCNGRYGEGTGEHTPADSYSCNDEYHYTYCSVCGITLSEEAHVATDDVTCAGTLCAVCNGRYGEGTGEHEWSDYCYNNETHYRICNVCSITSVEEAHVPTDDINCAGTLCAVCNGRYGEGTGEHIPADSYSYNDRIHCIYCSICNDILSEEAHVPSGNVTCIGETCSVCNGTFGETDPDNHYGADIWSDEEGHWTECVYCHVTTEKTAHIPGYALNCQYTYCAVCNYLYANDSGEHTWGNEYWFDSTSHWLECTSCGARSEGEEHTQADYSDCTNTYCSVCFGRYGDGTGEHTWGENMFHIDNTGHWNVCEDCGQIGDLISAHEWDYENYCFDENSHWFACNGCHVLEDYEEHSYDIVTQLGENVYCECGKYDAIFGDTNRDLDVNIRDAVLLFQYVGGSDVVISYDAADTYRDGKLNIRDVVVIFQFANGWDVSTKMNI